MDLDFVRVNFLTLTELFAKKFPVICFVECRHGYIYLTFLLNLTLGDLAFSLAEMDCLAHKVLS